MAYAAGDVVMEIKGTTVGGEIWSNSWGVTGASDVASKDLAATHLHTFYNNLVTEFAAIWDAQVAICHDKFANVSTEHPFVEIPGSNINAPLPSQLAVRASLKAGVNIRGGPFLTGWTTDAIQTGALLDVTIQQDVVDELVALAGRLDTDGMALALDSPTNVAMFDVFEVRCGQRFDVIRKRANDVLENYISEAL